MIYIVSGYMRTGTSMMMKALEAGGLDPVRSDKRDAMAQKRSDEYYHPNKGGLYEVTESELHRTDFPRGHEGKLLKVLAYRAPTMAVTNGMRVVIMRRDTEEIRQSYDAFFSQQLPKINDLDRMMVELKERMENRKDVISLHEFWYRDLLKDPKKHFKTLRDAGWEIDVEKCVEVVDPSLCRFKKEELEIGVV